jgi:hypothetical protein
MWKHFYGLTSQLKYELKQRGEKLPKDKLENKLLELLEIIVARFYKTSGGVQQDLILTVMEMIHYLLSHKVYYITTEFAQKMMQADIKFHLDQLKLPQRVFELCFEDDFEISGIKSPSSLVFIKPDEPVINSIKVFLGKANKMLSERSGIKMPELYISEMIKDSFSIRFRTEDDGICLVNIPCEDYRGKSANEIIDNIGVVDEIKQGSMTELSETEKTAQKNITKIILGLIAYCNTMEPDIINWKNHNRPSLGAVKPTEFLVGSKIRDTKWFIRSGGPVILAHERFKRDEHGNVRVIFRRAAEVNKHAKPSVPDEKPDTV